jgi:perosamine synthetase
MFTVKKTIGQHSILQYDKTKHSFLEYFESLYQTKELDKLHLLSDEYTKEGISDMETELHKRFYHDIKTNPTFKRLYCRLIKDIYESFFPNEKALIYQSFPSVRFQFLNNVTVPPHCDSDELGKHPLGEKNFLLPITTMFGTNRLFIESEPNKGDFQGIDVEYGDLFYFNGNRCIHYNEKNIENKIRISLDFRVMLPEDYRRYLLSNQITITNPRDPEKKRIPTKMIVGGYYQITYPDDSIETMLTWYHNSNTILQSRPNFHQEEASACYEYLSNFDHFYTEFKKTEELEHRIADYVGCKECIMTVNGNVALIIALMALDLKAGDDVIVPNYTMIASINSIKMVGANPIIVDVDPNSLTITKEIIESSLTPHTKAIMHVSLNNRSKDIQDIAVFCKEKGIYLIEDAAQSLGCFVDGKHYGTFGDIGCFSFSTPKIISTGQGGCLVTNQDELAKKIRMIKNFGRTSGGNDIFEVFGINFKFTDIQAVIGIEQMKKLPSRVIQMRNIFDQYYSNLKDVVKMIPPPNDTWIPWFVDIFVPNRDQLMEFLKHHHIQTRPTYPEINKTPMYYSSTDLPISQWISRDGLFLPTHTLLTTDDIQYICNLIRFYFIA